MGSVHLGIFPAFPPFLSKTSTYRNSLNVPLNKDDTTSLLYDPKLWERELDHYAFTFMPFIIKPLIYGN